MHSVNLQVRQVREYFELAFLGLGQIFHCTVSRPLIFTLLLAYVVGKLVPALMIAVQL
jgi:uncharacterized integral membrane protein